MKIRRLDKEQVLLHFESLYALKCRSLRCNFNADDVWEETCRKKMEEIPGYMEQGKAFILGAFDDTDKLIGFLWAYPHLFFDQKRMFINGLAVNEERVGEGVAKRLIEELKRIAIEQNCVGIDLHVAPFNADAIGFYRHMGFSDERIQMTLKL